MTSINVELSTELWDETNKQLWKELGLHLVGKYPYKDMSLWQSLIIKVRNPLITALNNAAYYLRNSLR